LEKYLDWCEKHRANSTYLWARKRIQSFCNYLGKKVSMVAAEIKPFHVTEWCDSHDTWGPTHKRGGIIAVQRPFSWGRKLGYISSNPLVGVEKPKANRRESFVSPEDFKMLCKQINHDDPFRQFLEFLWETGCRPQEARQLEARHVDVANALISIPPTEAKGRKRWRLIRLTPKAVELVKGGLLRKFANVFANSIGNQWQVGTIATRFKYLKKKLGRKFAAYEFRHGFAQRMLECGIDHLTVAELMGHSSGQMLATVYSHMNKADQHLREALEKGSTTK
jgi:integrase/recombinase XerC